MLSRPVLYELAETARASGMTVLAQVDMTVYNGGSSQKRYTRIVAPLQPPTCLPSRNASVRSVSADPGVSVCFAGFDDWKNGAES